MPCTTTTSRSSPSIIHHPHAKKHTHTHIFTLDHHHHQPSPTECSSVVSTTISAPPSVVWSLLRRFDSPQIYKQFVRSCRLLDPTSPFSVGSLREIRLISGIPAVSSVERLEMLDDERHVISFRVVGGEHRLNNYRSVTSLHEVFDGSAKSTRVVESYIVDVPEGNTKEDTCSFVDTIVKCNLHTLRDVVENMIRDGKAFL